MTEEKTKNSFGKIGAIGTGIYICILIFFVIFFWQHFQPMKPNEWGDFFAGTLGPVALIWVVLGFFLQGKELGHSVDALKLQAKELQNSVEQQKAMVKITSQQLKLDMDIRDEQSAQTIAKELPYIQFTEDKSTTIKPMMTANGFRQYWKIENVGADAISIVASISNKKSNTEPKFWSYGALAKNASANFLSTDGVHKTAEILEDCIVIITSENLRGKKRQQTFQGSMGDMIEMSCSPKRLP